MNDVKKKEKYKNWPHFFAAYVYRFILRARLKGLVRWTKIDCFEPGCTVVLGMCSKLPYVLAVNLECLEKAKWRDLKEVIIAVDSKEGVFEKPFTDNIVKKFPALNIRFVYYSEKQHRLAERLKLPYVYSWLSWVIAMNEAGTKDVLVHDYDALILSDILEKRYRRFVASKAVMQGVLWYWTNGIVAEDKIAATFEAFVDMQWVRRFHPIRMMNQVGLLKRHRRVDYDTLTDMQANGVEEERREIYPMSFEDLVHPTQMIHQYTVFRKHPAKPWHSASLLMIPFFYQRSGLDGFLKQCTDRVRASTSKNIELLGDGVVMNFEWLPAEQVDWMLKQMLQVCIKMETPPFSDLVDYGNALYDLVGMPERDRWTRSFEPIHLEWIRKTRED